MGIRHVQGAGGSLEGHSWASNTETRTVAGAGILTAIGGGLFGRTCVGWCGQRWQLEAVWWTRGHHARGQAAGGLVVAVGALVGSGVGGGAPVATLGCWGVMLLGYG
jgi:hypothetical protein